GGSGGRVIFTGMAIGAGVKLLLAIVFLCPGSLAQSLPFLPKGEVALEVAPALIGVGYILGYRQSAILVAGSIVASLALIPLIAWFGGGLPTPLYPETQNTIASMTAGQIWGRYVRYIGAGAVATAGILTVLKNLPVMAGAARAVLQGLLRTKEEAGAAAAVPATDRDLPPAFIAAGVLVVVAVSAFVPGVFAGGMGPGPRLVCAAGVALFGILFVAVAARIVGIVGVTSQPTSGITLVTLLGIASLFAAAGWTTSAARAAVLTVGTIVAVAASKAGDISQDLKTGWLVGATPARQQLGQLLGAAFACFGVAATVLLLGNAYTFGSTEVPAPQATLMKTIIEGVLAGALPWGLVLSGAGIALSAILCGVSGLAFAIGVYLPLASMAAIYVGGAIRAVAERRAAGSPGAGTGPAEARPGVLAASGLVAGEGLAGVLVAGLVASGAIAKSRPPLLEGDLGRLAALGLVAAIAFFLLRAGRRTGPSASGA
ncbi:MAG TPA: OPT/YSL family transporter, partial [Candidatus Polarisedimenticolia bacterium]|nr:OPT/YSL family transporter [Candidatus Polarisedimenticolia bacterium]